MWYINPRGVNVFFFLLTCSTSSIMLDTPDTVQNAFVDTASIEDVDSGNDTGSAPDAWIRLTDDVEQMVMGSCASTSTTMTVTCDASITGQFIYIVADSELKPLGNEDLGTTPAARGAGLSLNLDETTAVWSGGVGCGGDYVVNINVERWMCVAQ